MQPNQSPESSITVGLHGLTLTFHTPNAPLRERFETVYGHLPQLSSSKTGVSINWDIHQSSLAPNPPAGTPIISKGDLVSYYGADDLVLIRMPKYGLITVDLSNNRLLGVVTHQCLDVYGAFEDVLMISLAPLYRRRGWFPLHAFAALAPNNKAALITGEMGSGKTTTGLALLSAGWKLLSNDTPLLTMQKDSVHVLAYPGRLSAFDDSLVRFASLKKFIPGGVGVRAKVKAKAEAKVEKGLRGSANPPKRVFRAEEAFADPWAAAGVAGGVFFPQVVPGLAHSELVQIAPKDALLQLIPQAIEGWDKAAIGQSLQLLSRLVEQVPCYTLRLSPHMEQLPSLIASGIKM
jgi:hypothetical protein